MIRVWRGVCNGSRICSNCFKTIEPGEFHYIIEDVWDEDDADEEVEELGYQCTSCGKPDSDE